MRRIIRGPVSGSFATYFDIYHRHFAPHVGKSPNVLEIGVYSGGSLGMWHSYFGQGSRIIGVDIMSLVPSDVEGEHVAQRQELELGVQLRLIDFGRERVLRRTTA